MVMVAEKTGEKKNFYTWRLRLKTMEKRTNTFASTELNDQKKNTANKAIAYQFGLVCLETFLIFFNFASLDCEFTQTEFVVLELNQ